jgi:hypothetical protein
VSLQALTGGDGGAEAVTFRGAGVRACGTASRQAAVSIDGSQRSAKANKVKEWIAKYNLQKGGWCKTEDDEKGGTATTSRT